MENVHLQFQYTKEEYIKAYRQFLVASKTISQGSVLFVLAYTLHSVWYLFRSSFSTLSVVRALLAFLAVLTGSLLYFYKPGANWANTEKFHQAYTLTKTSNDNLFSTPTVNSTLNWGIYSQFWESDDFYFLFQTKQTFTFLPKRAFASPTEMAAFETLVGQNLGGTKRKI